MICMRGGFVIQRHNELRDLEAELLNMVCKEVVTEPVLQDVEGEQLTRGSNKPNFSILANIWPLSETKVQ